MARATALETAERVDHLQVMILEGEPNTACLAYARTEWGISRARGYELLKRAWTQIKADVDGCCWSGETTEESWSSRCFLILS